MSTSNKGDNKMEKMTKGEIKKWAKEWLQSFNERLNDVWYSKDNDALLADQGADLPWNENSNDIVNYALTLPEATTINEKLQARNAGTIADFIYNGD